LRETKEKQNNKKHTREKWEKVNKNKGRECRTAKRSKQACKAIGGLYCAFGFSWSIIIPPLRYPAAGRRMFSASDVCGPKRCLSRVFNDTIRIVLSLDDQLSCKDAPRTERPPLTLGRNLQHFFENLLLPAPEYLHITFFSTAESRDTQQFLSEFSTKR
jgi:hypothetical protein